MEWATKTELREIVEDIRNLTGRDYTVEWAYGRPRLYSEQQSREVSPRLPMGEMREWLWAFRQGIEVGISLRH